MSRGTSWRTPAVVLLCGGLILMLALGTRQSFGLFLRPMSIDLGCGREVFSFAIALQNLVWGLGMPVAGSIADRYGAGRVLTFGWVNALIVLGAIAFLIIPLGAALAGRNRAAQESEQSIGEALGEAMRHRGFWLLTGSFFVCGFQTIFVMTHLPAYAVDRGLTP